MVLMLTRVSEVVKLPVTSGYKIRSLKHSEPSSLLAWEYAAALTRVTLRGFGRVTGGTGFGISRTESGSFGCGANDGSVLTEGDVLESCYNGFQKKILPNTQ